MKIQCPHPAEGEKGTGRPHSTARPPRPQAKLLLQAEPRLELRPIDSAELTSRPPPLPLSGDAAVLHMRGRLCVLCAEAGVGEDATREKVTGAAATLMR